MRVAVSRQFPALFQSLRRDQVRFQQPIARLAATHLRLASSGPSPSPPPASQAGGPRPADPSNRASSSDTELHAQATRILDSVPAFKHITNTQSITLLTGLCAFLVSKELYVFNDETIVLVSFLGCATLLVRGLRPALREFTDGRMGQVLGKIKEARQQHQQTFEGKKGQLGQIAEIEGVTKQLFETARDTVAMEARVFELRQKQVLMQEARSYLDAWVKHEASLRDKQQKRLAQQVMDKLYGSLKDPQIQNQILSQCVADLEVLSPPKPR